MSTDVPFVHLSRVLRTGWVLIVVFALVFGAAGALAWYLWPTKYSATATVQVSSGITSDDEANMQTEERVARSTSVLTAALEDVPAWRLKDMRESVTVTVPREASVLDITSTDVSAKRAATAANSVARAYLDDRRSEVDGERRRAVALVEAQMAELEEQISGSTTVARRLALENRLAALSAQYAGSRAEVNAPGRVLSFAEVPESPTTPGLPVWVAVGGVAGALLGFYVASVRDRARRARGE